MALRRWEPFPEMTPLREAMDRLFEQSFLRPGLLSEMLREARLLPVDMYETEDNVIIRAQVPGLRPEDIDIRIVGDTVTISGERKAEEKIKEEDYLIHEMPTGRFHREIISPVPIKPEAAKASFENGVLTIELPKTEKAKMRQVKIQVKGQRSGS